MHLHIWAELLLAEPFAGTSCTVTAHGSLSWLGVDSNPKHTTKPPVSSRRPASVASCEWPLLADQRLQEPPSFCSELQLRLSSVGTNATERIRSSVLNYSLRLWLKTNGKRKMSDTTDSGKNAFNICVPEICPNTCCKWIHAVVQFLKSQWNSAGCTVPALKVAQTWNSSSV